MGSGYTDKVSPLWQAPRFSSVSVGQINAQTASFPTRIWMDDVAMGPRRIGCPRPKAGPTPH